MSEIKNILEKHQFRYKQSLGQNFITDTNLLSSIVKDSGIDGDTVVIEIGAGAGTLTKALAAVSRKVFAYEIDENLIPVLNDYLKDTANVEIINKDIMKVGDDEIRELAGGKFAVVANLPYYITTPVIMRFLESDMDVQSLTVMVQKEVADRIVAKPATAEYGAITAGIDIVADAYITRNVTRKLFYPVPNVDSAVLRININKNKYPIGDINILRRLIRCAFGMRRKTLINNICSAFPIKKDQGIKLLNEMGLDDKIRGEALNTGQFVQLANIIGEIL